MTAIDPTVTNRSTFLAGRSVLPAIHVAIPESFTARLTLAVGVIGMIAGAAFGFIIGYAARFGPVVGR